MRLLAYRVGAKRRGNLQSTALIENTRSPYPASRAQAQKRLAMTDQNTMSGPHFMGVFPLFPLFPLFFDSAGLQMSGHHFMGVFPLFPLFPLFFDSAGWLFECKNSFVKVRRIDLRV